ncbi:hypothetical protein HYW18_03300 [Candidatus Uhrbacteria bacterium]|nr:hypothetical protein [Candidatus Uhrbacteria bacterium]
MGTLLHQSIPVEAQTPHVHLSERHGRLLFGETHAFSFLRPRPYLDGQFVYREDVRVAGPSGMLAHVTIIGPAWEETQLELSLGDARVLGLEIPDRDSGDTRKSPSVRLQGPAGAIDLTQGVLIPLPHLHLSPNDAEDFHVQNGQRVRVCLAHDPRETFDNVLVRIHPSYQSVFHVMLGSAPGAWLSPGVHIQLVHT